MFKVIGLTTTDCDAKVSHTGKETYQVEDLLTGQRLNLCPACLLGQMRLRNKGRNGEKEASLFEAAK